jgi:PPOX class probable F420-dependent enzyme
MSTVLEAISPDLQRAQCIALTTFRQNGQAITTPVWFAIDRGTIYVETHADAGKLKRLRHCPRVTLAPCAYNGKVTGTARTGYAVILTETADCLTAAEALSKKYGGMRKVFHVARNARRMLGRKPRVGEVYIAIQPM